ncbi:MAG: sugar phosphate nucleotidyltransferase [Nitrospinota bacterium]|nr:sugar phosphate nucleotidyltransferase [Nitrospinota bacterium]
MNSSGTAVIILAAGKGKRMKSDLPKVLHLLRGKPLINWVISAVESMMPARIIAVVGHKAEEVERSLSGGNILFARQEEQLGTGHAVAQATGLLSDFSGDVFVLCGDVPLIKAETLREMLDIHRRDKSAVTLLSVIMQNPAGYGRILRDSRGNVIANVEEKCATESEKGIREINGGIYVFDSSFLFDSIGKISSDNAQGEYFLPDLIKIAVDMGLSVSSLTLDNYLQLVGVNRNEDLKLLEDMLAERVEV